MTRSTLRVLSVLAAALALPLMGVPALAHVTANPNEADSTYFRTALRVGHGCEGSPTIAVRVQIPEGVDSVKPEVIPGWEIEIVREDLPEPVQDSHGNEITDRIAEIAWRGGSLPDEHFQEFGLNLRIADDAPEVLWLPTVQECVEGAHRWIEIPPSLDEWSDYDEPAPYVQVVSQSEGAGDGSVASDESAATDDSATTSTAADSTPSTSLVMVALIAGLLGLGIGVTALIRSGRRA